MNPEKLVDFSPQPSTTPVWSANRNLSFLLMVRDYLRQRIRPAPRLAYACLIKLPLFDPQMVSAFD
jgi:hypothetical protein